MPKRYNINPIKDFDLTEYQTGGGGGSVDWGQIYGSLSNQSDLQTALNNKVNDTGDTMTGDLAFTNAGVTNANQISFNTSATETISEGVLSYSSATGNLELGLAGSNTTVAVGKSLFLPRRVKNSSGTTMTKGTVVYISGVSGTVPVISRALATNDTTSAFTIGVTAENILDNHRGWVITTGELAGINLTSFTEGDTLYLSATNAGQFTAVPQLAPYHYVRVGIVTKATASGEMIVNVINGYELKEIHDVSISGVQTGQLLQYQSDGLWKNVTVSGTSSNHNSLSGIQGGSANEYYHLTSAEYTVAQATFGSNTGDVSVIDTRTIDLTVSGQVLQANVKPENITHNSLSEIQGGNINEYLHLTTNQLNTVVATSGSNTGDLSVLDTRTIDLTVSGQLLQASVIPSAITHNSLSELQGGNVGQYNHLTNNQLTVVQNTSGVNTGNQIVPSNLTATSNNFVTAYDSTTGNFAVTRPTWANIDKTTSPINDLSDVTITSINNNQALIYNSSTSSFENKTLADTENLLDNSNFINNSTNGYGSLADLWSETGTTTAQGGFPELEFNKIYDGGNLTALYYLQEASGSAVDDNGVFNLSESTAVASNTTASLMAKMRTFSGTNRFSGTIAGGNVVGEQTFFAFVRPSQVTTLQHIAGYNDGTRSAFIGISATGKPFFNFTGTTPTIVTADVACEINKWYLIIGSYNGSTELRIFVNGVYKAVSCTGTHVVTTNSIFQIGATNSLNPFTGSMNCVGHILDKGFDLEKMKTMFAVTLYSGAKIQRTDTVSEISCFQLLDREQMHRFANQTITFTAEAYQEAQSNAKLTIYSIVTGNIDSNIATTTGGWVTLTLTTTLPTNLSELYLNVRSSDGVVGAIWYRNLRLNYGGMPMGEKIYSKNDKIAFPRLLNLDIPNMFDGEPYQYEENRWYSWTPTLAPAGTSNSFTTKWRFSGKTCTSKGQITSTQASATWTHTLPIKTGSSEKILTRHLKIQNNAGVVALGNWSQGTENSTTASMFSSIANAGFNAVSGVKIAQIEMIEWEID